MKAYETDLVNGRQHAHWVDAAGIEHRANLLLWEGARIPGHAHDVAHTTMVIFGWIQCREKLPNGTVKVFQLASFNYKPTRKDLPFEPIGFRCCIEAGHEHEFTLIELQDDLPGQFVCLLNEKSNS